MEIIIKLSVEDSLLRQDQSQVIRRVSSVLVSHGFNVHVTTPQTKTLVLEESPPLVMAS